MGLPEKKASALNLTSAGSGEPDIIMVHWRDAQSRATWGRKDKPCNLTSIISVGFFNGYHSDETGEYLSIYATRDMGTGNVSEMTAIPAGCIISTRVLERE
ncbi:MAG: hypothetical protein KJ002_02600 [Candidatus Dadabacteria bacterium]|nr:hypothetical protein [Candidatus Dadabacteria bacterium]